MHIYKYDNVSNCVESVAYVFEGDCVSFVVEDSILHLKTPEHIDTNTAYTYGLSNNVVVRGGRYNFKLVGFDRGVTEYSFLIYSEEKDEEFLRNIFEVNKY